ncbi:MAG: endolytic transglycosylase MltG [Bacteroidaceae bacterium]|nr:endolytic transglycosylase MltG [Bacteroidaceae bacterium]
MAEKKKNVWVWMLLCMVAAAGAGAWWMYRSGFDTEKPTYIYIDTDDNVDSVSQKIEAVGQPQNMGVFHLFASLLKLQDHLHTGRYEVTQQTTALDLVRHIRNHNEKPINLVVPSVRTMADMAGRLAQQLMVDSASIAQQLNDVEKVKEMGYTQETLPALFIPNTYEVYWDISVEKLFARLVRENKTFWNKQRIGKLKSVSQYAGEEMTKEKVVTLAAIVDSETANNGEKPNIAGLYLNRMRIGMPLQSDPTVIYALKDFSIRRVLHEHLKVDSPYNTYKNVGLPPGPIRVASIAGIDAVLNYAKHDYLYMCAKEDFSGTHNFAVTYAEHQHNAACYVRALNERGIR